MQYSRIPTLHFPALLLMCLALGACNSEATSKLKRECDSQFGSGSESSACKKGVELGFSNWRWGGTPEKVSREEIETATQEALEKCHDRYPGGAKALPLRNACMRGVRMVRDFALGYLQLLDVTPQVKGTQGGKAVTDETLKPTGIDASRLNQIRDSFIKKGNTSDSAQ